MPAPPLDLDYVRSQFPALMRGQLYFDNGGGTQVAGAVIGRAVDYLMNMNVQPVSSAGGVAAKAAAQLLDARRRLAAWIHAESDQEIILGASTTLLLRLLSESFAKTLAPGDEIIVTDFDHEANIGPWDRLRAIGVKIRTWRVRTPAYSVAIDDLNELLSDRTRLVCVSHCSNVFGTLNPVAEIADAVHRVGAKLCVDGVAFAPHREVDVQRLKADFYVISLYKTFGPHYALLYGKRAILRQLPGLNHFFIDEDTIPYKLQPGGVIFELAYAATGIVDYLDRLGERMTTFTDRAEWRRAAYAGIAAHEQLLTGNLLAFLNERSDVIVLGNRRSDAALRIPVVSFVVNGRDSREIARQVGERGISLRCGDFYMHRYYHEHGLDAYHGILRVSLAHYNSVGEVDQLIAALTSVL